MNQYSKVLWWKGKRKLSCSDTGNPSSDIRSHTVFFFSLVSVWTLISAALKWTQRTGANCHRPTQCVLCLWTLGNVMYFSTEACRLTFHSVRYKTLCTVINCWTEIRCIRRNVVIIKSCTHTHTHTDTHTLLCVPSFVDSVTTWTYCALCWRKLWRPIT